MPPASNDSSGGKQALHLYDTHAFRTSHEIMLIAGRRNLYE
jgi:hypothetical protein